MALSSKPTDKLVIFLEENIEINIIKNSEDEFSIIEYYGFESGDDPKIRIFDVSRKWLNSYISHALQVLKTNKTVEFATPLNHVIFLNRYNVVLLELILNKNALIK